MTNYRIYKKEICDKIMSKNVKSIEKKILQVCINKKSTFRATLVH